MSYINRQALGLNKQQEKSLVTSITDEDLRSLPTDKRIDVLLRHKEIQAQRTNAFWNAVSGFASVVVPLATFLGISAFRKGK